MSRGLLQVAQLVALILVASADDAPASRRRPSWQSKLSTYSIASVARREGRRDWNEITQGNKVVLPLEVYNYLSSRGLPFDKFQLLNPERKGGPRLFTGPLDFCAAPGECYLPSWVMHQLGLKPGDACAVATACFPNAAFVKFQPHTSAFLDVGDHNSMLTTTIENLGGLTQGAFVRVTDGRQTYNLDVLEVKGKAMPAGEYDDSRGKAVAIGIFECPVEFAEPKDMAKKKKKSKKAGDGEGQQQEEEQQQQEEGQEAGAASKRSEAAGQKKKAAQAGAKEDEAAAPVPKFKRRKAAEAAGEAPPDSPFAGKARSLGRKADAGDDEGEDGGAAGAEGTSELAKAKAAMRRAKEEEEAAEAAALEAANAPPPLVAAALRVLELVRVIIGMLLSALKQIFVPSDVNFDG